MERTLLAALIGAAGGLVVWLFNWLWLLYSGHKTRTRIRTMLSIEVDENLAALRAFLSAAQSHVTLTASPLAEMQRRDQFATALLPTFKHATWTALLASIPLALQEQEIRGVHQFHLDLDELARLKTSARGVSSGHEWSDNFGAQINALLRRGNPLKN
jgi:hypothetical protein